MDAIGLTNRIAVAVELIARGRVGLRTEGQAENGRAYFHEGLELAQKTFAKVANTKDAYLMLLAEYTFVAQELAGAHETEKHAISSCQTALKEFDDAFKALDVVKDATLYKAVDKACPTDGKYRYNGFPKDAFHVAYIAHRARAINWLKPIGIDPDEIELRQRRINLFTVAQNTYADLQKKALVA